jgi:NTE family protein
MSLRCLLPVLLAGLLAPLAPAWSDAAPVRTGLVLSGGGARGLAHVGVLLELERAGVRIDAIVGTSMGAVIGGLYASGMTAQEIERLVEGLDWRQAFRDAPPRDDLAPRLKRLDRNFLVSLPVGFGSDGFTVPRGLLQGQRLTQVLRRATLGRATTGDFDQLPITYRAIATDIETGAQVVLDGGDLVTAMRASLSAPGLFAPVERDGRLLVDGGLVNNLPVDVARTMGVDRLIVVDVGSRPLPRESLDSALAVTNQMLAVVLQQSIDRQRSTLTEADLLIEPALGALTSLDFTRVRQFVARGREATDAHGERLAGWTLQQAPPSGAAGQAVTPSLAFVRGADSQPLAAIRIERAMGGLVGQPLDPVAIEMGVRRLYGTGLYEGIDYRLVEEDESVGLEVTARPKSWGPNYLRFGLELQDDFEGGSSYSAGTRLMFTQLNRAGGELLVDLQMGERALIGSEWHQPLSAGSSWFVAARAGTDRISFDQVLWGRRVAEYRLRESAAVAALGRELGSLGEIRLAALRSTGSVILRTGEVAEGSPRRQGFERGLLGMELDLDTRDSPYFPRSGQSLSLGWWRGVDALGNGSDFNRQTVDAMLAGSRGRNALLGWFSAGIQPDDEPSGLQDLFRLGGLFNLSGLAQDSLTGRNYLMLRGLYFRQIGRGGPGFLQLPAYLGVSLEAGNTWDRRRDVGLEDLLVNAAGFVGLDTPLGPVYLAIGVDEEGRSSLHLNLGGLRTP